MRIGTSNMGFIMGLKAQRKLRAIPSKLTPTREVTASPESSKAERLNELRAKIQSGTYQINFDKLAQKILEKEISS
jgi:anti-sigma28 factor (negative regulator of flagellin synthesis)